MARVGCYSNQRLLQMLGEALHKEIDGWRPVTFPATKVSSTKCGEEIAVSHRDSMVCELLTLHHQLDLSPDTFFLSVSILDTFLSQVKARPKYLKCIGVTCYYLAAKVMEEDEVIPSTLDLVRLSGCGCSVAEILRMERCVLDKLAWHLPSLTPLQFLHIFHMLLLSNLPHLLDECGHMTASRQLSLLTAKLEQVVCNGVASAVPPHTLALAVLSLELELFSPNWLTITFMLQKTVMLDTQEVIQCRELICPFVSGRAGRYVYQSKSPPPAADSAAVKRRRVLQSPGNTDEEEEEDNMYAGIERLYEEVGCRVEAQHDVAAHSLTATPTLVK